MNKTTTIFTSLLLILSLYSCGDIDQAVIPVIGVYEAHVQGVSGPFSMSISADRRDDVIIEAPFDGFDWVTVTADIDDEGFSNFDIDINQQDIAPDANIEGEGFFFDDSFQIDYSIEFDNGDIIDFTMVGSKI